ncbi:cold shock domain-containing protein [Streptomyces sp. LP05-1]|uniref:Cold shock domain-containing protein n=1 Tax=Streptomyces pyxinae TaxID=2970734 RepID=A0ABT2CIB4_9ACTN|nr:cold shock domain-containing protein [Streptomyces sp. LP05-1]MCS0636842.1 cold shock domain-containing protein [Streptomyces sp. LP05-1]
MLTVGRILRFDEVRGYGFIVPREGGEDVFMHANDLLDEKYLYQAGREVEFLLEMGDKGPKASGIRLLHRAAPGTLPAQPPRPARTASTGGAAGTGEADGPGDFYDPGNARNAEDPESPDDADDIVDVLTDAEFRGELTEALLDADATLTAGQLKRVRSRVAELARAHGWVEG